MIPLDLIDEWTDENWPDAFIEPFTSSEIMPEFMFPTMVFASLLLGFYVYSDSLVLPFIFAITFGPAVGMWVAGAPLMLIVGVMLITMMLLFVTLYWRISRG